MSAGLGASRDPHWMGSQARNPRFFSSGAIQCRSPHLHWIGPGLNRAAQPVGGGGTIAIGRQHQDKLGSSYYQLDEACRCWSGKHGSRQCVKPKARHRIPKNEVNGSTKKQRIQCQGDVDHARDDRRGRAVRRYAGRRDKGNARNNPDQPQKAIATADYRSGDDQTVRRQFDALEQRDKQLRLHEERRQVKAPDRDAKNGCHSKKRHDYGSHRQDASNDVSSKSPPAASGDFVPLRRRARLPKDRDIRCTRFS